MGNLAVFLEVDARPAPPEANTALLKEALARSNRTSFQARLPIWVANFPKRDKLSPPARAAPRPETYAVNGVGSCYLQILAIFLQVATPPAPRFDPSRRLLGV